MARIELTDQQLWAAIRTRLADLLPEMTKVVEAQSHAGELIQLDIMARSLTDAVRDASKEATP